MAVADEQNGNAIVLEKEMEGGDKTRGGEWSRIDREMWSECWVCRVVMGGDFVVVIGY